MISSAEFKKELAAIGKRTDSSARKGPSSALQAGLLLTKAQEVRRYQLARKRANVRKGYPEFDADQPRAADGTWSGGGGSAAAGGGSKTPESKPKAPRAARKPKAPAGRTWGDTARDVAIGTALVGGGLLAAPYLSRATAAGTAAVRAARRAFAGGAPLSGTGRTTAAAGATRVTAAPGTREFYTQELSRYREQLAASQRNTAQARENWTKFTTLHGEMPGPFEAKGRDAMRRQLREAYDLARVRETNAELNVKDTLARLKGSSRKRARSSAVKRLIAKGYPEFDPNQARGEGGQWSGGGGGSTSPAASATKPAGETTGEKWRRRAINAALIGGGVAAGIPLASRGLGSLTQYMRAGRLARTRAANRAARAHMSEVLRRAEMEAAAAREARGMLGRGAYQVRRGVRRMQGAAARVDAKAQRGLDRATAKLPPKVRDTVRRELRHGAMGPDPAGKMIELPTWMWPF